MVSKPDPALPHRVARDRQGHMQQQWDQGPNGRSRGLQQAQLPHA